jgi:hypothetical protein
MIARWQTLAQRIRMEVTDLEPVVIMVIRHWDYVQSGSPEQAAFVNSVALNLHGFYNGLERIMELIALEMDGGTLGGDAWHTELLRQMTLELPTIRPALWQTAVAHDLDEYRKFRHLVRHIYAIQLDSVRIAPLVQNLTPLWKNVREALLAFANFLENLT